MALNERPSPDVASHTLALLRTMDRKIDRLMEIVLRHDVRLGRVERDIGEVKRDLSEVKSDIVLLENKVLNQTNDILSVVQRIDETFGSGTDFKQESDPTP